VNFIQRIKSIRALQKDFGTKWVLFRIGYALRMRSNLIRLQIPAFEWKDRPLQRWVKLHVPTDPEKYAVWRKQYEPKFLFEPSSLPDVKGWDDHAVLKEADQYLAGISRYFSKTDYQVGFPPDWHLDPKHNCRISTENHWSKIADEGPFDIKFIWEASRFSQIYTLVRAYARTADESYPQAFWTIIEDWMEKNPPGKGPNWKDGQEASLRLMALCFGYYAFKDHPSSTPQRIANLSLLAAVLADRISANLDYAIYTRSNHTISESFGIWLAGTMFPELRNAQKYRKRGKQIMEREAGKQIYQDGSYAMQSINYQRFVLHIYLFALRIAEVNEQKFSTQVSAALGRAIDFLYNLIDLETGRLPMIGSNDGALVLPLNNCDYLDFRPLIQLGYYSLNRRKILPSGEWDEDLAWLFGDEAQTATQNQVQQSADKIFKEGGISKISATDSVAFIRCGPTLDRPTQADQNHFDLWWQSTNIALDAGTYLYNGKEGWRNRLAGSQVHNSVTVDRLDQMDQFSRFIWVNWSNGKVLRFEEKNGSKIWQGQHDGYQRLPDPVDHQRTIILLDGYTWMVIDHLKGLINHEYRLHWLLDRNFKTNDMENNHLQLTLNGKICHARFGLLGSSTPIETFLGGEQDPYGWISRYYGHKEAALSVRLTVTADQVIFWSCFDFNGSEIISSTETIELQSGFNRLKLSAEKIIISQANGGEEIFINPLTEALF